ncbi:SRA-YDG, PUA-like domain protein [Artemisia annua]|uniref:SRA-YDG, PUA-like domain protein n=1 Tax=Artemisia annua TaxID=35608 RepID=A0A2U1K945_ARTAN|nr:SRA-YDG, PUA-like domain protein [Artemisia annua]
MEVLNKKIEHVKLQKRSLDDSNDHELEAFKKSKTLVSTRLATKTEAQVQEIRGTSSVRSKAHVKSSKKLSNTDILADFSFFVDNKDKRFKPPVSRGNHSTRPREMGKVKFLEPTCLKHGQILIPKVNISAVSRRTTSNITNARDCNIWKSNGTNKFMVSHKEVLGSQKIEEKKIEEIKILFDVIYKQESYQNKLKLNGEKNHHWKVLSKVEKIVKRHLKLMDAKKVSGSIPGVKVGNTFKYRQLLKLVGLHCQRLFGIDYTMINGKNLAISIVDSHRYFNERETSDMLTYCGEGGIGVFGRKSQPKDQKLEKGNLALKNCLDEKSPIRVIRKINGDGKIKMYVYDGLYIVKKCTQTRSEEGKTLFKFHLQRIPGQPQLQTSFNTSR